MPARPTIAFLVDNLYDGFQDGLWRSVAAGAAELDVNLLSFLGGSLIPRDEIALEVRWGRSAVFDLVHPDNVDGIVGLSASIGNSVGDEALERFYARYAPLPIVSLCRSLPGRPSLVVDNGAGVRELVGHLVTAHGRRRIAFLRGPVTSADAEERFAAYRAALDAHGLPFDPAYVFDGNFDRASGKRAVEVLLDERGLRPEAFVGANDYMALHAMAELGRRGIDVPGEVAVVGFDDMPDAAAAAPSLTTVRQPLGELGHRAVQALLRSLRGERLPPVERLPTQLVLRESCGCPLPAPGAPAPGEAAERIRLDEEAKILSRIALPKYLSDRSYHETLAVELPTLGIQSFYLCGFVDELGRRAELRAHYDLGGRLGLDAADGAGPFPSARILPSGFRPAVRHAHAVLPICYLRERLGYAVCDMSSASSGVFERLASHMSSVTKFTALVREVRRQTTELEAQVASRTHELRETQHMLLDTARQAGMAEVAVGVLHNVGNLLNSVGVCAEAIRAHAGLPQAEALERVVGLLAPHRGDLAGFFQHDPRAALVPEYLERLAADLRAREERARDEATQLLERVSVIRDAIRGLQELARGAHQAALHERVDLAAVAEAALEIQRPLLLRHVVQVRLQLDEPLPLLVTERSKVLHVLVNLVKNAVEAMREAPEASRFLTITGRPEPGGEVRLSVSDTGVGIPPENFDRIFSYGFTTKPDGHGFGLHSCALYVRQLGGTLVVRSDGPGRGATFTMSLPVEPATVS